MLTGRAGASGCAQIAERGKTTTTNALSGVCLSLIVQLVVMRMQIRGGWAPELELGFPLNPPGFLQQSFLTASCYNKSGNPTTKLRVLLIGAGAVAGPGAGAGHANLQAKLPLPPQCTGCRRRLSCSSSTTPITSRVIYVQCIGLAGEFNTSHWEGHPVRENPTKPPETPTSTLNGSFCFGIIFPTPGRPQMPRLTLITAQHTEHRWSLPVSLPLPPFLH